VGCDTSYGLWTFDTCSWGLCTCVLWTVGIWWGMLGGLLAANCLFDLDILNGRLTIVTGFDPLHNANSIQRQVHVNI
jgi:hypothetical protein